MTRERWFRVAMVASVIVIAVLVLSEDRPWGYKVARLVPWLLVTAYALRYARWCRACGKSIRRRGPRDRHVYCDRCASSVSG